MKDKKNIMIIGSGRLGSMLAKKLSQGDNDVTIVDYDENALSDIEMEFSGFTHLGDATSLDTLVAAGIEKCDIVLCVTNNDNVNIFTALVAKSVFNVNRVVAKLYEESRTAALNGCDIITVFPSMLSIEAFHSCLGQIGVESED